MESIGLLIEFKKGRVKAANLGMAAAAGRGARQVVAFVIDAPIEAAKSDLAAHGISRIININTANPAWNPEVRAAAVVAAMDRFEISSLIGLTSPEGRELLPRIAARLDAPLVMDCIDIDLDNHRARTSQYSGKTIATIALTGNHFIYGLRANVIAPCQRPVDAEVVEFSYEREALPEYQVLDTRTNSSGTQYMAEADVIIAGGRGMKSGENFQLLFDCARHINASVGASRVAVDNGWVPYAMQVGQTGMKVNPKVYLAVGISGSVQHFAGMKTARMIIAVNTDENAAIMANCDYFAVGDLFQILPELERGLAKAKTGQ
jgi:electron transfer flavoprotein alpha subunit